MEPLISVIIPVYNQAEALRRALDTIAKQTYKHVEVIVIDDGSDPPLEDIQLHAFPLHFFRQENKGAPAARNKGFALSKGEYIIFWDADIVALDTRMIEKMFEALTAHPEVGYVYSDFYFGKKKMHAGAFDADRLKHVNYITTTSLIQRKDFPGFDESLKKFQDWDVWLTMLGEGKVGYYVSGYLFRIQPGGTMSRWLPRFAYTKPWKWLPGIRHVVKRYEAARGVIAVKHHLSR